MHWNIDKRTSQAATKYPFFIKSDVPVGAFPGRAFDTASWNRRVIQPSTWHGELRSNPEQIMQQFREERYTQALAMVVSWGTMWRRPEAVWGKRKLESIEAALRECANSIRTSESIADSWDVLRSQLSWTSVLISKTLHFMCLSLGFDQDAPVPIDGAVVRERVWPKFRDSIPVRERPENWDGDAFEAYSRYMTAILTWANQRHWSTADVERTICAEVRPDWV
jgi:hypothetical protein